MTDSGETKFAQSGFDVYGQDHSPWVQTVLLGLHEKGVAHTLTTAPPFSVFRKWGVMMPAASVDGAPWQLESADILQQVGYGAVSQEDLRAIYGAWQGVTHRAKNARRFFHAASLNRDPHPSCWRRLYKQFLRSFAVLYFYLLIQFIRRAGLQPDPENFVEQFLYWERKLEEGANAYLGGDEPDLLDLMLFGVVQCHCSIPGPPVDALQKDPGLTQMRSWIATMQERFMGYRHLYSGVYFKPYSPEPEQSTSLERAAFWLGSAFMIIAFPITIPLIIFFASRIQRKELKT